jgi:hypothetical protein
MAHVGLETRRFFDQTLSKMACTPEDSGALTWTTRPSQSKRLPQITNDSARLPLAIDQPHNPKVVGSNPAPATTQNPTGFGLWSSAFSGIDSPGGAIPGPRLLAATESDAAYRRGARSRFPQLAALGCRSVPVLLAVGASMAKPTRHRGKWRIRWIDATGKRQSEVYPTARRRCRSCAGTSSRSRKSRRGSGPCSA